MQNPSTSHRASAARKPIVPNAILGVVVFIITEAMFFAGLISAYVIAEAGAAPGTWPPPNQPRLPVEATLINTVALLASGAILAVGNRRLRDDLGGAVRFMMVALALGAFFLVFQGYEWVSLLGQGLTMQSSNHGSFFYLIVGMHGVHVLGGLSALGGLTVRARQGQASSDGIRAASLFWYFVVGLWPILYWQVYL